MVAHETPNQPKGVRKAAGFRFDNRAVAQANTDAFFQQLRAKKTTSAKKRFRRGKNKTRGGGQKKQR